MIRPEFFIEALREKGIDCFAGVPDSLLKNICAYITDHFDAAHNIIAARYSKSSRLIIPVVETMQSFSPIAAATV